ncbi:hypothetical protein DPMN_146431 [Dreissena polymorpha]|uniref:Peptidase S59 domain-containing protein n=1 Tax=Dreissena polymorpha TaxID=45954 RepID=A0A9D4FAA9_DREPO|nr:hypothetical protein DPMN_146431 [Dreissena polymorpha]
MTPPPPHPAGIVLMRPGYYTIPPVEALAELVDEDGNCYVEDFTIGREGYGSIFFPGMTNIANMNFDEIVFFRRKEVIVYPDDDNKPQEGEGLNKKAEITLDCVWPRYKSAGTPIKSPEKLKAMNWQEKIEFNSMKVGAKFIDYRPETGSWVFEVRHFSKYGLLDDSDEEEVTEQDKKRLRTSQAQQVAVQGQTQQTRMQGPMVRPPGGMVATQQPQAPSQPPQQMTFSPAQVRATGPNQGINPTVTNQGAGDFMGNRMTGGNQTISDPMMSLNSTMSQGMPVQSKPGTTAGWPNQNSGMVNAPASGINQTISATSAMSGPNVTNMGGQNIGATWSGRTRRR